ncbi:putative DNA primase/helicase [Lutimaribacter saemankumensis]|uniref:Putative DNA primase/helicase n=2 Tax=Lutimaribacter saemankumensis TaxID=490829 RepID=A0A1G8RF91_9RHOB|nr:putative DNA primase/helicase [Lutimaribacter saemankumensis]
MDGDDWDDLPKVEDTSSVDAQAEIQRLAGLSPAAYETERKNAAIRLGWRASVLDREVEKARPRDLDKDEGKPADLIEELEPWHDPVEGASLAEEIRDRLRAHVVFGTDADVDCATLWVLGTYLMDTWRLWPRLLITSPTRACGKSTLLEVIDALAHRGFIVSNASSAAIFRAIEAWKPTLLLDEADTWMKQNEELAGILNSGHSRRAARVIRVQEINGEHVPTPFSTWCPMVIAGIGSQRDTLMSRCILIGLRRKLPEETVDRMPVDLHEQMLRVRRQIARWAADTAIRIGAMADEPPVCGNDRLQDNFTPLWRLAAALGGAWPDRIATAYAGQSQSQDDSEEPAGVMMLHDIAELFATRTGRPDRIASSEIVADLIGLEDRPWAEWRHGKPLTSTTVAKLMKPFGIKAKVLKLNGTSTRVYLRSEVEAAAARYTASKCNPVTLQQNQQVSGTPKRNPDPEVTLAQSDNPLKSNTGYGVTLSDPGAMSTTAPDDPFDPDDWK